MQLLSHILNLASDSAIAFKSRQVATVTQQLHFLCRQVATVTQQLRFFCRRVATVAQSPGCDGGSARHQVATATQQLQADSSTSHVVKLAQRNVTPLCQTKSQAEPENRFVDQPSL